MVKKIQIAVDIRDLRIAKTGSKTYLEEITREFKKGHPDFSFHFLDTWLPVYTGGNKLLKIVEHIRFFSWKQLWLPLICAIKRCDILFCTDYFVPLLKGSTKTVVVFYDAFFWEYPNHYNRIWLFLLNTLGVRAAKNADAVITITHYSKKQIMQYTGIDADKIYPIHLAPKSSTKQVDLQNAVLDPHKKYILHIGVMEKRKNIPNLIRAFHLLLQEGYQEYYLVLVGSSSPKMKLDDSANIRTLIQTLGLQERVLMPGFISDEQLAHYYKSAAVYAFVSINEGFGLPVLEAFQNNLPTLISNNSCLPEVGGDAVITCDPFNEFAIRDALKTILDNPSLQKELVEKGKKRLSQFSWQTTASELLEVFKKIDSMT